MLSDDVVCEGRSEEQQKMKCEALRRGYLRTLFTSGHTRALPLWSVLFIFVRSQCRLRGLALLLRPVVVIERRTDGETNLLRRHPGDAPGLQTTAKVARDVGMTMKDGTRPETVAQVQGQIKSASIESYSSIGRQTNVIVGERRTKRLEGLKSDGKGMTKKPDRSQN